MGCSQVALELRPGHILYCNCDRYSLVACSTIVSTHPELDAQTGTSNYEWIGSFKCNALSSARFPRRLSIDLGSFPSHPTDPFVALRSRNSSIEGKPAKWCGRLPCCPHEHIVLRSAVPAAIVDEASPQRSRLVPAEVPALMIKVVVAALVVMVSGSGSSARLSPKWK